MAILSEYRALCDLIEASEAVLSQDWRRDGIAIRRLRQATRDARAARDKIDYTAINGRLDGKLEGVRP